MSDMTAIGTDTLREQLLALIDGRDARHCCEPDSAAAIGELRARFGDDRPRLVEATEHRQGDCPVSAEDWVQRRSLALLVQPGEQLRDRGRTV